MKTRAMLTLGLLLVATATLAAQGFHARQRPLPPEAALRHRAELQLTDDQVKQLRSLREETVKNRHTEMAARMELRSKLMAGEITRQEFRTQTTERVNAMDTRRDLQGDPVRALLNDSQRDRLQSLRQEMRQQRAAQMETGRGGMNMHRGWMDMHRGGMNIHRGRMDMRPALPDSN